jgi:putative inorganic carbon (hco3(-)) transporter
MSATANSVRKRPAPNGGFIFGWLLVALFVEYSRPASFFPFLAIPMLYSMIPFLLFVASFFAPGLRSAKEAFSDRQARWIFAMLGVLFLSMVVFGTYAIDTFTSVLGYVMLFVVTARVCHTWERIRYVIKVLLAAHGFLLIMNPSVLLDPGTRHYIMGATFLGDGNDFGLSLSLLFPCALWVAQTSRSKLGRLLTYASLAVLLYAIIATQSRGATVGIAAVMFFLWWYGRKKAAGIVLIAIAAVGALAFAPSAYFDRMGTLGNPTDGSAQGRIEAWKAGIGMGAKNPVIGVGAGHFGPRWGKTAHSTYVLAFGELGLPGFVCVLGIVIGNVRATMKLRKRILATGPAQAPPENAPARGRAGKKAAEAPRAKTKEEQIASTLLLSAAAMVGFGVAGAFLSATYYPHIYLLTGLMMAARAIAAREAGVPVQDPGKAKAGFRNRRNIEPAAAAERSNARPM